MRSLRLSRAWLFCALLTSLLLATVGASARSGRAFTGYYDFSGVQEQGDVVQVTLHVKLFNHTPANVKGVIVTLLDSSPAMTFRGNFQPVKVWKTQQFIEMSQEFTISKRELGEWIGPTQPNLVLLYQDNNGRNWQRPVQLSRRPLVPPVPQQ